MSDAANGGSDARAEYIRACATSDTTDSVERERFVRMLEGIPEDQWLKAFESRKDVRAVFDRVHRNPAYTADAATRVFIKVIVP